MREISLRGARDPYISMAELRDWANARGGQWTTDQIRLLLRRADAVVTIEEAPVLDESKPVGRPRKTTRRRVYTTRELLMTKVGTLFTHLLASASDEDVEDAMGQM